MATRPEPAGPRARSAGLKRAWDVAKVLIAGLLIVFVISKTDLHQMALLLSQLSLPWLGLSFILFCSLTLIKAYQYFLLTGRQASYARVLHVVIVQNALSNFVAGGAGIASYLTMLSVDDGLRLRRVLSSFIVVKVSDLLAVWMVLLGASALLWDRIGVLRGPVILLLVALMAAVLLFMAAAFLRDTFISIARRGCRALRLDRWGPALRGLDLLESIASQDTSVILQALRSSLLLSFLYMAVTLVWFYTEIRAYSLVFPFVIVSFVNAFIQLISWVPIQVFGGLGVSETSLVYLFGLFELPAAQIAAMGLGLRIMLYGFTLLVLLYLPVSALFRAGRSDAPEDAARNG